jgi:uncharacterized protein YbbC (DUF1343 family)
MFNAERKLAVDLEVVPIVGWNREQDYDKTGLTWRNPSPNMRHLTAALLYPGIGLLETTNVSVGRGTERPFEWIGAPWVEPRQLAAELRSKNLAGVRFVPVIRTPTTSTHKGQRCGGVDIIVDNWSTIQPVRLGLEIASTLRMLYPNDWQPKNYNRLLVHKVTYDGLLSSKSAAMLEAGWQQELKTFLQRRSKYLIYP